METFTYKEYEVEVYQDESDHLWEDLKSNADGHMDYFTTYGRWNDYELFDVNAERYAGVAGWLQHINDEYSVLPDHLDDYYDEARDKAEARVQKWIDENLFILPINVYEHGGITMSTGGYGCQWDSGQAGFIYSDKKRASDLAGKKRMSKAVEKRVYEAMESHIKYSAALCEGSVYGYTWDHGGCGGFVIVDYNEDNKYMEDQAKQEIDYYIKSEVKKHCAVVKGQIKNKVPAIYRQALEA